MGTDKFNNLPKVRYADISHEIQSCDLFFASGNYNLSRMIEEVTDSIFSHVAILCNWNSRVLLLESVEDEGVRALPLSQYVNNYEGSNAPYDGRVFIGRLNTTIDKTTSSAILGKGADLLNRKYNKEEIAEILARTYLRVGQHSDNNTYICSEFVDVCFQAGGIFFPRESGGFIYPEDIAADPTVTPLWELIG